MAPENREAYLEFLDFFDLDEFQLERDFENRLNNENQLKSRASGATISFSPNIILQSRFGRLGGSETGPNVI